MDHQDIYDVTIIGGGPAGLYSAFYSGMRDLKTKVIEYQPELGGKINVYKEKTIWDIGALPATRGEDVIAHLVQQAKTFNPTLALGEKVIDIERTRDGLLRILTDKGSSHHTKTIILATGYGILREAKLTLDGADRYESENLLYAVSELERFRDKDVIISGGGNSAVDWANEIEPIAKSVTVVHRRDQFGGHEKFVTKMKNSSVNVMTPYAITGLDPCENNCRIQGVEIEHCESKECVRWKTDAVIVNHGFEVDLSFLDHSPQGLVVEERRIQANHRLETTAPGIYVAGDIANHESKLPLIAGTFNDAALAINAAKRYISPEADAFAMVSSHHDRLKSKVNQ